jgi:tRNA uracil 4-sulfurtransferase
MPNVLLIHYSEIGTKGKNRSYFERRLAEDVRRRLTPRHASRVRAAGGRVLADLAPDYDPAAVRAAMDQVFGVAWYAFARSVSWAWEDISREALALARARPEARTFKIYCSRADKTFPLSSDAVCRKLGQEVSEALSLKADMESHDVGLYVEALTGSVCVYAERFPGRRGMPGGSSGRMICLFSGGIDSPVAAWLMMRRGAKVDLLHFHPYRKAEELAGSKIAALHDVLKRYDPSCRLFLVPHYPFQVKAALGIPSDVEMVLFRRFIFRAAEELARRRGAKALITGDSLGQVASQTAENLAAAQGGLEVPVLPPLIARDKEEIVKLAKDIGTYEPSILPYKDCCSLMSRHPKTAVPAETVRRLEVSLDFKALVEESLSLLEVRGDLVSGPASVQASVRL